MKKEKIAKASIKLFTAFINDKISKYKSDAENSSQVMTPTKNEKKIEINTTPEVEQSFILL